MSDLPIPNIINGIGEGGGGGGGNMKVITIPLTCIL